MLDQIFHFLDGVNNFFWGYIAFVLILVIGLFFSFRTGFFQIRCLPQFFKTFFQLLRYPSEGRGIHPLKAFFASTGGMIGIGNVVGVVAAVQIGGPGALFWIWVTAVVGSIVKYCEIYLGTKFRVKNKEGGYDGGPMYFLKKAFNSRLIPLVVALLFCVYGVEIYQFSVITESVSTNWHINRLLVIGVFLALVLWAGQGGVKRIGKICSWVMPFFLVGYLLMGMWVILHEVSSLPQVIAEIFRSAFTGQAAVGGFAGSTVLMAIQQGMSRGAYSSDIGVGYDSIIQSESKVVQPEKQAHLSILGVLLDNLICTISILIVLLSGIWKHIHPLESSEIIKTALSQYFPYMEYFIPFFFLVTGYTTIIAFLAAGVKCARYIAPQWGKRFYMGYAILSFIFFSFLPQGQVFLVMAISGSMLLIINIIGMYRLRREIVFDTGEMPSPLPSLEEAN